MDAKPPWITLDAPNDLTLPLALLLALVTTTFLGVGDLRTCALLGLMLCALGVLREKARADWRGVGLLTVYVIFSALSSHTVYASFFTGYAPIHAIYPVILLLLGTLGEGERLAAKELAVLWAAALAVWSLLSYTWEAVAAGGAGRLGGALGNPNATGIFFVIAWLALQDCGKGKGFPAKWFPFLEPPLLMAATLTLSMGSFGAMVAGLLLLSVRSTLRESLKALLSTSTRIGLAMGTGLLLYLGAARTGMPLCCLPILGYALAVSFLWPKWAAFLEENPRFAMTAALAGMLAAAGLLLVLRPSALSTFGERLEMMENGLSYLTRKPLLGLGPYQWRLYDLRDGGKYFATWHIHNVPLHLAVETGWPAAIAMTALPLLALQNQKAPGARVALLAFCIHNLMDTSFFYTGVTTLVFLTAAPGKGSRETGPWLLRGALGLYAAFFGAALYLNFFHGLT